jgi:hypothetical protein
MILLCFICCGRQRRRALAATCDEATAPEIIYVVNACDVDKIKDWIISISY